MKLTQLEITNFFNSLKVNILPTFEGDIPSSVKDLYPAKKRLRDHYTSRLSLINAVKELRDSSIELTYQDVLIENHLHLKSSPEIIASVTHTNSFAAAVVTDSQKISSVGIDIESRERQLKEGIKKFYILENDEIKDPLELWCIKEAAFKAISPLYKEEKRLVLKDITVKRDGTFLLNTERNLNGYYRVEEVEGHFLALAIILKTS